MVPIQVSRCVSPLPIMQQLQEMYNGMLDSRHHRPQELRVPP